MATFSASDLIFATVSYAGRTLLETRFTGVKSFDEIIALIRRSLAGFKGYVRIRLRNGSQGWSRQSGLRLADELLPEGLQLSLF